METNLAITRAMVSAVDNNDVTKLKILLQETNQKNPIIIQYESIHSPHTYVGQRTTLDGHRVNHHIVSGRIVFYDLTALEYSAIKGKLDIFKSVSDSLQDINPNGKNQRTSLHLAAMAGHLSIGKAML